MYKCVFPNCTYCTDNRSLIELHHIHPKELGVTLNKDVTISLCPTHHKLIYHPDATSGQHAIKHPDSLSVSQVAQTNRGYCVIFKDINGNELVSTIDTRQNPNIRVMSWSMITGLHDADAVEIDDVIGDIVDKNGYYVDGNQVYYIKKYEHVAKDMLANFIVQYMLKTKQEYDDGIRRARADYKKLKV